MKKRSWLVWLSAVLICLFVMSACSSPMSAVTDEAAEKAVRDARQAYRSAAVVVRGVCIRSHTDTAGLTCYDLEVSAVLAGEAGRGDIIHCTTGRMDIGTDYLLYLSENEQDVFHAEDMNGYSLLTDAPIAISDNRVSIGGASVTLTSLINDMRAMDAIISIPAERYYYASSQSLMDACDEVFIGIVEELPQLTDTAFRAQSAGGTVENSLPASVVTIKAYGSLKGTIGYGDDVKLVYSTAMCEEVIDANTLKTLTCSECALPTLKKGGIYLFFLIKGPDAKQEYYFTVNPIQGMINIDGEQVTVVSENTAISGYYSLTALVREIKQYA